MALPGGRTTFDRLVSDSLPAALRFAIRLTGRADAAEDIVQEAMLRALRSWKTYRCESQFHTWLFRIIVNAHRDRIDKLFIEELHADSDSREALPEDVASATELADIVARSINALPLRQREVIVLSIYEGLDAQEISRVLDLTVQNVYSTMNVAREKLRRRLVHYRVEEK